MRVCSGGGEVLYRLKEFYDYILENLENKLFFNFNIILS